MQLATNTLNLIEARLQADQGAMFRKLQGEAVLDLTDAFDQTNEPYRSHLGASAIGNECVRELWYGFRWALTPTFSGRILRLFNRGHLEEARFIALLRLCGFNVWSHTPEGHQLRIKYGHFGGSCDAIVQGCPDVPNGEHCLTEFKTHGDRSFNELLTKGLVLSKYTHYVQMQIYMNGFGLKWGLYLAVNKNTDALYAEVIPFNYQVVEYHHRKAEYVISTPAPPRRISESAAWYQCKMCSFAQLCHYQQSPDRNCRTCTMSQPLSDGNWVCRSTGALLSKQDQIDNCNDYRRLI
jgi:hypothetical protein